MAWNAEMNGISSIKTLKAKKTRDKVDRRNSEDNKKFKQKSCNKMFEQLRN